LVGETVAGYSNVLFMFGFAVLALAPALVISRMISPRTKSNPVKFLPMECYILMFVIFDVMAIFLYAWGSTLLDLPKEATLPILAFLGIMFAAMAFALYQTKRKNIW